MTAEDEGRNAAEAFREQHRLGVQPLGDLVTVIEQATGYDVAVLDAAPDEHGMAMRDPEHETVFVAVARTDNPMRQRSSLAHELAHVLFGDWTAEPVKYRSKEEIRADAFARHLLIPHQGLRDFLADLNRDNVDVKVLSDIVQRFLVSPRIAAIALQRTGQINAATKDDWFNYTTPRLAARFGWSEQYAALQAASSQMRAPKRLVERAIRGYVEGVVSIDTVASLRGVSPEQAQRDLEIGGITIEEVSPWGEPGDLPTVDVDFTDWDEGAESAG